MKILTVISFCILALFINVSAQFSFEKNEIIIVENPRALLLFDKYKQSFGKQHELLPFTPFFVAEIDSTDQLQLLLKTFCNGETVYIGLQNLSKPIFVSDPGKIKILTGYKTADCAGTSFGGTDPVFFYPFSEKKKRKLNPSESQIHCLARKGKNFLVKTGAEYGIIHAKKNPFVKNTKDVSRTVLSKKILSKIENYFTEVNLKLAELYSALNTGNKRKKTAPQFVKKNSYEYEFVNGKLNDFPRIKNYLLEKINLLLLTEKYKAETDGNTILISLKQL